MDFMVRYHGSKGVPECLVEDGVLGILALPGDLEESASHHSSKGSGHRPAAGLIPSERAPKTMVIHVEFLLFHVFHGDI